MWSRRPPRAPTSRSLPALLHGDEAVLYGDQAYWKEADRQAYEARGVRYRVNRRARSRHHPLSERWRKINRARSRTRARCEHPFYVVKQLWGFAKVRYRGEAVTSALGSAEERREMLTHETVEHGVLGGARPVCVDARGASTLGMDHPEPNG
jgi:IS5 family transposase